MKKSARKNKRAQATTELAIMGAIIILGLSYLLQQGYVYNCRQALEMYTFRQALKLSREGVYNAKEGRKLPVGINLTVIRDIIVPSFFSGLNRQSLMATASIEQNPFIMYVPKEADPDDLPTRQLLQVNEAMIRNGYFIEIPPTLMRVKQKGEDAKWMWGTSAVADIDFQSDRSSTYDYITKVTESKAGYKYMKKDLASTDTIHTKITFQTPAEIQADYLKNDLEKKIETVQVGKTPQDVDLVLEETVKRGRSVGTQLVQ